MRNLTNTAQSIYAEKLALTGYSSDGCLGCYRFDPVDFVNCPFNWAPYLPWPSRCHLRVPFGLLCSLLTRLKCSALLSLLIAIDGIYRCRCLSTCSQCLASRAWPYTLGVREEHGRCVPSGLFHRIVSRKWAPYRPIRLMCRNVYRFSRSQRPELFRRRPALLRP